MRRLRSFNHSTCKTFLNGHGHGHVESDVITECQVFFGFVEFSLPCTMLTVRRDTLFGGKLC